MDSITVTKESSCFKELHTLTKGTPNLELKMLKRNSLCLVIKRESSCIRGKIEEHYCETCGEVLTREVIR